MKQISLAAFDVDGTLTDGTIQYIGNDEWSQRFHVRDGLGLKRLMKNGIPVVIISAATFLGGKKRAEMLGIDHAYFGVEDKLTKLKELADEFNVSLENVAYMGDDLSDLEPLKAVGLAAAPADAIDEVKQVAMVVTKALAGKGAVRELSDYILSEK